ncbi:hypothetical protein [Alishewanella longhuensis]
MIVGYVFENDINDLLKGIQHDSYPQSVTKIFLSCRRAMSKAEAILGIFIDDVEKARDIVNFDHRVLQDAHDIIAAAYRYKFDDGGQLKLGESIEEQSHRYLSGWGNWLEQELDELTGYRRFAHSVIESVIYKNTDKGYKAEHSIADILLTHYSAEDWMPPDSGYLKAYPKT